MGVENSEQFGYIKLNINHNIISELRKGSWITDFCIDPEGKYVSFVGCWFENMVVRFILPNQIFVQQMKHHNTND